MPGTRPVFVVHVIHHLVIGGMENGVVNLINNLPRDRCRHAVVCIEDYSDFRSRIRRDDVEVYALHRSRIGVWALRWQLLRLLRRLRPDVVHSRNLSGLDALLPARLSGARTVHSEHGFDVSDLSGSNRKLLWLRRLHQPLVGHYITVSRDLQRLLTDAQGVSASRISQIYNGVDTDRFTPIRRRVRPADWPAHWPHTGVFVVGTVGRAQVIKDQRTLLSAFARAAQQPGIGASLRLLLVGDGPQLPSLRALALELGIDQQVWFAGARQNVAELMQQMDLFVLSSLNEGISNTLLEAMATGLPVLATAVGGNVELLECGGSDAGFTPGDVERLAAMIENHALDPALCAQRGASARRRVVAQFSLHTMMANYLKIYEAQ